jgi:sorbitol-specific phosphotransferase system component IIC
MARIVPDGWREFSSSAAAAVTAAAQRHHETLELFSHGLPDEYTVYHAVHWTTVERGFSVAAWSMSHCRWLAR